MEQIDAETTKLVQAFMQGAMAVTSVKVLSPKQASFLLGKAEALYARGELGGLPAMDADCARWLGVVPVFAGASH